MVPVVAISGFPGSGKTTLTRRLAAYFGVPAFYYDDFETVTSRSPAEIRDWIERGSDYDEIELNSLVAAIERAADARPPFILVDTLLGRAHTVTNALISLSLWLDVPADIALARKMAQSARRASGQQQLEDFAQWIASYARHYEDFIAGTYTVQAERVRERADRRLSQWRDSEALLEEAVEAILATGVTAPERPSVLAAMERFGAGFGYERSIKFTAGEFNDDRYITSVHRDDIGMDARAAISSVVATGGLGESQWTTMLDLLPRADVIHFGHEGGSDPVRKIYLEFVSNLRDAARAGKREPQLLYLALKWRPGEEHRAAFNRYILVPDHQVPARMIDTLRAGYKGRSAAVSLRVGSETIRLAAARAGERGIMFIEVEEEGTGRFSYDITIYSAELKGRDLDAVLAPMFDAFGVGRENASAIRAKIADQQIGHISVGVGSDGRDFVTVYYGVESRAPTHG